MRSDESGAALRRRIPGLVGRGKMAAAFSYQMVLTVAAQMRPSRLMTGTLKWSAVPAMMRSGMSGTSSRETRCIDWTTSAVKAASVNTCAGFSGREGGHYRRSEAGDSSQPDKPVLPC